MIVGHIGAGSSESGIDTGDVQKSLRFSASRSTSLSKAGFNTSATATYFAVVKRGRLGAVSPIFDSQIKFNANDTLTAFGLTTSAVFRDPSAFLFIVVGNGELRINGVSFGAVTTSAITGLRIGYDGVNYFDGYMARVGVVDTAASGYANFGYFNAEINEWVTKSQAQIKAVVDAGGANSFMLDFDNGTSLTTLGYDKSSKGNNWTLNNHSLTAGVNYDWMRDVPGNSYATLNPLFMNPASISAGNLVISGGVRAGATFGITSGKWYWEAQTTNTSHYMASGLIKPGAAVAEVLGYGDSLSWGWYASTGQKWFNSVNTSFGSPFTSTNDRLVVAFDADSGQLFFYKNGVLQGGGAAFTGLTSGPYFPALSISGNTASINCGQRPFTDTALQATLEAAGFKTLCQRNLPDPAINNPEKYFDVKTHVGNGAANSITSLLFAPDFIWTKSRSTPSEHGLQDSVRGANKELRSNSTAAEVTHTDTVTAFTSSGVTFGADASTHYNASGVNYVDWLWKAGDAPVANTDGSIASQVSANQEAGFSIVTYTGTGANATVGHGLGVAPKMVLVKARNYGGATDWVVYSASLLNTEYLVLNGTGAKASAATMWNSAAPTSSVFSLGSAVAVNNNTTNCVAYCFAEIPGFSKISSYVGNGSVDGPFVYCGFKPKYVLIKSSTVATSWYQFDSARNPANEAKMTLFPDTSAAEASNVYGIDFTSSGFKLRAPTGYGLNNSGESYVFYAVADAPFKYANAR